MEKKIMATIILGNQRHQHHQQQPEIVVSWPFFFFPYWVQIIDPDHKEKGTAASFLFLCKYGWHLSPLYSLSLSLPLHASMNVKFNVVSTFSLLFWFWNFVGWSRWRMLSGFRRSCPDLIVFWSSWIGYESWWNWRKEKEVNIHLNFSLLCGRTKKSHNFPEFNLSNFENCWDGLISTWFLHLGLSIHVKKEIFFLFFCVWKKRASWVFL